MLLRRTWIAGAMMAMAACLTQDADAAVSRPVARDPQRGPTLVSVEVVSPYGGSFASAWHEGRTWVAGVQGERYNLRLTNHTGGRVEAVVTVDGRDVVDGDLGDYRNKRGYVIEPYGSVTIDGFRQSFDQVAAFRFTDLGDSYSTRMGTPQHNGVIGVAVFREQPRVRRRQSGPIMPGELRRDDGAPSSSASRGRGGEEVEASRDVMPESSPTADATAPARASKSASSGYAPAEGDIAADGYVGRSPAPYARRPAPRRQELGTEYGESQYSAVHEVRFIRRHRTRPDQVAVVYYDSFEGLVARGVWMPPPPPVEPDPEPFPRHYPRFAPPPPR